MKKIKYLFYLLIPVLLSSCMGINTTRYVNDPVQTKVELSGNNFQVVKMVTGEVTAKYVFGIGGLSQKNLKSNAIAEMYKNADLQGRQTIVNITVATSSKNILGALAVIRTATAYGYIIDYESATTSSGKATTTTTATTKAPVREYKNATITDAQQKDILTIYAGTEKQKKDKTLSFNSYKDCYLEICFLPQTLKRKKDVFAPNMELCTTTFYEKFNDAMGAKNRNFKLVNTTADLKATYYVCDLSYDGDVCGYVEFKDKSGKVILRQYVEAKGGKGIKLEKSINGSMENSAEELAKSLKPYFKKQKK